MTFLWLLRVAFGFLPALRKARRERLDFWAGHKRVELSEI